MTNPQSALEALQALADPQIAAKTAKLNKVDRPYLGVSNPQIDVLYKEWRNDTDIDQRVVIAAHLWDSNIHEARIAAAKLLTQARINPDKIVWDEIIRWVPECDSSEISDHACAAGARRLPANLERLDTLELWTMHDSMWVRRAALIMTLPWAKLNHPSALDLAARDRVLGWAAIYAPDHDPAIQKAIALWLRTLSKHDKQSVLGFLDAHGSQMNASALKEASVHLL
jgi:3-methyladenine DNA glycosylase AlkD